MPVPASQLDLSRDLARTTVFERQAPDPALVQRALAGSRLGSFWLDDVPDAVRFDPLAGDGLADLVVVGGGYTGLWTALLAAQRYPGRRVVVLEGRTVGWSASGRNGGFCEASLTHGEENGRRRWPEELARLDELGRENLDAIGTTVAELGIDAQWERTGTLAVAVEPHQLDWLEGVAPDADGAADAETWRLDEQQVRAAVASPTYLGGSWYRHDTALVHPARLVHGLARAAADAGVVVHERTRVLGLEGRGTDRVEVRTEHGTLRARQVVLATNAFPSLLRRTSRLTVPVYDYALMTEPLTPEQRASIGWRDRQGIADLANQFHYYRLTADDRVLFGGYDAIYHRGGAMGAAVEDRTASYERLASHFLTTFPQLEDVRFSHRWGGAIDTSTRFCATFGTARAGRVAYAVGFTGLGVGASRFGARVALDLLDEAAGLGGTELTALRMVRETPLPFPPEPVAGVGIDLTRWSLDRADHRQGRRNLLLRTLDAVGLGFDS